MGNLGTANYSRISDARIPVTFEIPCSIPRLTAIVEFCAGTAHGERRRCNRTVPSFPSRGSFACRSGIHFVRTTLHADGRCLAECPSVSDCPAKTSRRVSPREVKALRAAGTRRGHDAPKEINHVECLGKCQRQPVGIGRRGAWCGQFTSTTRAPPRGPRPGRRRRSGDARHDRGLSR